jgi:hypothetical protein
MKVSIPQPWKTPDLWGTIVFYGANGRVALKGEISVTVRGGLREDEIPFVDAAKNPMKRVFLGYRDAEVEIAMLIQDDTQLEAFSRVIEMYRIPRGQKGRAVDVAHPSLVAAGVRSVYIKDYEFGDYEAGEGWPVRLYCTEYVFRTVQDDRAGKSEKPNAAPRKGGAKDVVAGPGRNDGRLGGNGKPASRPPTPRSSTAQGKTVAANPSAVARGYAVGSNLAGRIVGGR